MQQTIAKMWVNALRSGHYNQGEGALKTYEGFCCLGVLCDVLGRSFTEDNGDSDHPFRCEGEGESLPETVREEAGMRSSLGNLPEGEHMEVLGKAQPSLAHANDGGATFQEIADFIETHYEIL